MKGPSLNFKT